MTDLQTLLKIIIGLLGTESKNQNGKRLTLVQALGSRGDRSLLIG